MKMSAATANTRRQNAQPLTVGTFCLHDIKTKLPTYPSCNRYKVKQAVLSHFGEVQNDGLQTLRIERISKFNGV